MAACRCGTAFYSRRGNRDLLDLVATVHAGQQLVGLLEATLAQPQAGEPLHCAVCVIAIHTAVRAPSAISPDRLNSTGPAYRSTGGWFSDDWTVAWYTMNH